MVAAVAAVVLMLVGRVEYEAVVDLVEFETGVEVGVVGEGLVAAAGDLIVVAGESAGR